MGVGGKFQRRNGRKKKMTFKSLHEANNERLNHNAVHADFPVGTRVKVVCLHQDCYFFNPDTQNTNGTVIRNSGSHIGIIVKWDISRRYESHVQEEFNFGPKDLIKLVEEPLLKRTLYIQNTEDAVRMSHTDEKGNVSKFIKFGDAICGEGFNKIRVVDSFELNDKNMEYLASILTRLDK